MRSRGGSWQLLTLTVFALAACAERPTAPEVADLLPETAFGKPDGKPGGGGKPSGGGEDYDLLVQLADGSDGIRSDLESGGEYASDRYIHGESLVSAQIRTNGMFYFQAFDGKRKDVPLRGVTVDLGSPAAVWSQADLDEFQREVIRVETDEDPDYDGWPVFTSDVTLHTRNTDGGMYTMGIGSTLVDGGKIGLNDYGDGGSWEWRLLFDTRTDVDGNGVEEPDNLGLCVTHPDADTWFVTAEAGACGGAVDGVTELWRVADGAFVHVADFDTPMHLILRRN